jgi:tetratricopeptide (TPR) repeat protein
LQHEQGNLAKSQTLLERALSIREEVLGAEHPDTAASLYNLAHVLHDQGDLAGAVALSKKALGVYEGVLGPEHS